MTRSPQAEDYNTNNKNCISQFSVVLVGRFASFFRIRVRRKHSFYRSGVSFKNIIQTCVEMEPLNLLFRLPKKKQHCYVTFIIGAKTTAVSGVYFPCEFPGVMG